MKSGAVALFLASRYAEALFLASRSADADFATSELPSSPAGKGAHSQLTERQQNSRLRRSDIAAVSPLAMPLSLLPAATPAEIAPPASAGRWLFLVMRDPGNHEFPDHEKKDLDLDFLLLMSCAFIHEFPFFKIKQQTGNCFTRYLQHREKQFPEKQFLCHFRNHNECCA